MTMEVLAPPQPVACRSPPCSPPRQLRALLAALAPAPAPRSFDSALLYLHGFPDLAVHPTRAGFASRLPLKLADWWLQRAAGYQNCASRAFVTFNFGGVPGSDRELRFSSKTVSMEAQDAVAACEFVRGRLLCDGGRLHVVGLSTGAIVAALLRAECGLCDSIAVVAGLLDVPKGVEFDFAPRQLAQMEADGFCWKEFYLPEGAELPQGVELSFDGENRATDEQIATVRDVPSKLFMRLDRQYVAECLDGSLDVRGAVSGDLTVGSGELAPLLVVHGSDDHNVPLANGEALFAAAAEPKMLLVIPRANHLLTNSKHLKKALQAIGALIDATES